MAVFSGQVLLPSMSAPTSNAATTGAVRPGILPAVDAGVMVDPAIRPAASTPDVRRSTMHGRVVHFPADFLAMLTFLVASTALVGSFVCLVGGTTPLALLESELMQAVVFAVSHQLEVLQAVVVVVAIDVVNHLVSSQATAEVDLHDGSVDGNHSTSSRQGVLH